MRLFNQLPASALCALAVLALNACASKPFYDTVPEVPMNISPENEADISAGSETTFTWQATERTQYYDFHIFNRVNGDIEQHYMRNLQSGSVCQSGTCSVSVNVSIPVDEDHAWRVRAGNNAGVSGWSRTLFNMVGTNGVRSGLLTVPSPLQPISGSVVQSGSLVNFVWGASSDATSYDFHLFDTTNQVIVDELIDIPATTVCQGGLDCQLTRKMTLPVAAGHAWRVRSANGSNTSAWTRTVFSVEQ